MKARPQFKRVIYPIKDKNDNILYYGSYTIKENLKTLGFKGERIVQVF